MAHLSTHKKPIATLLLLAIFGSLILGPVVLLYPKKAKATGLPVFDAAAVALLGGIAIVAGATAVSTAATAVESGVTAVTEVEETVDKWFTRAVRVVGQLVLRQILAMMTNDIIAWINGEGKPRFVSDWGAFLKNAADAAAGAFIDEYLGMGWLCKPFDLDIKIALLPEPTFEERVRCTISDIVENIEDFYDDFSKGGWQAWVRLVEPRNNIYGAYLLALDAKMGVAAAAREAAEKEAMAGEGFLGERDEFGNIKTPGKIVSELAGKAVTQEIDLLREQIADLTDSLGPFEIYVVAIANALINRVIKEGLGFVGIGEKGKGYPYDRAVPGPTYEDYEKYGEEAYELFPPAEGMELPKASLPPMAVVAQARYDVNVTQSLKTHQELLKENATKLLGQQNLSLTVLNDIKETQEEILDQLQADYANGLSLPSWAKIKETSSDIFQITATDIGSVGLTRTATSTYEFGTPQPQVQTRIDELGKEETFDQITLAEVAIPKTDTLIKALNTYIDLYQENASETNLAKAETKMREAKEEAVIYAQAAIDSNSLTLYHLDFDTTNAATDANFRATELEAARSTEDDPAEGSLYEELDELEDKLEEIQ